MTCNCAGILFGDGSHDAGCPALVAEQAVGPRASGADHSGAEDVPVTKDDVLAAFRKLLHYQTTAHSCGCPDYQYRRRPKLTICKHIRVFRELEPYLKEVRIMPIKGLTHDRQRMLPRVGKLKLGFKKKHSNGKEYPVKTDHFVLPPDLPEDLRASFIAEYGETPKEITIILPTMDLDVIAPTWYKAYQQTRDWVCKGDGERAIRKMNPERVRRTDGGSVWGPLPAPNDKHLEVFEVRCPGRQCPDYKSDQNPRGACGEVMNVQFLMPDVEGYGVWQIDTGSFHSITGFYDSVAYLNLFGNFAGVPLTLTLEPKDVTPFGKKITVYVLKLRKPGKLENMLEAAKSPMWNALGPGVVPEPDEEADDLLHASDYAPEGVVPLPDDDDYSNAANVRRVQAGVPQRHGPLPDDIDPNDLDHDTGEIRREPASSPAPPEGQRTFDQALADCDTPDDYTALLRDVLNRKDDRRFDEWLTAVEDSAADAGYVIDKVKIEVQYPQVNEVAPADANQRPEDPADTPEEEGDPPESVDEPADPQDETDETVTPTQGDPALEEEEHPDAGDDADDSEDPDEIVICAGPCGEEVSAKQVNAAGECSACQLEARTAGPATEPAQKARQELEPAASPLF